MTQTVKLSCSRKIAVIYMAPPPPNVSWGAVVMGKGGGGHLIPSYNRGIYNLQPVNRLRISPSMSIGVNMYRRQQRQQL